MFTLYPWHQAAFEQFTRYHPAPSVTILTGPQYTGTRAMATYCAASLLCASHPGHPCGQCRACQQLMAGTHEDYVLIDPEGTEEAGRSMRITVEMIREVLARMTLRARHGAYVVVIHPAEHLTSSAANALLKCLEEPYTPVHFFLVVSDQRVLLPTIRSRAQCCVYTPLPDEPTSIDFLHDQGYEAPPWGWSMVLLAVAHRPLLVSMFYEAGVLPSFLWFFEHLLVASHHGIMLADQLMADVEAMRHRLPVSDTTLLSYCIDGLLSYALGRGHVGENDYSTTVSFLRHDGQCETVEWLRSYVYALMELKALCQHPVNSRLLVDTLAYLVIKR